MPHRQAAARAWHSPVRRRADRFGLQPGRLARRIRKDQKRIAETFRQACDIAEDFGERLAAEGEICWGGMHSWRRMVQLLELVDRPGTLGFQADMAHTLLYMLGYNAPEDRILPQNCDWNDPAKLDAALATITAALRLGRTISTSRRTTPRSTAPARTTRRAGIACRTIPTASSTSSTTPASGSATATATSPRSAATSAGTAACSPTTR